MDFRKKTEPQYCLHTIQTMEFQQMCYTPIPRQTSDQPIPELDAEFSAKLSKFLLDAYEARWKRFFDEYDASRKLALLPFSDIDNDDLHLLFPKNYDISYDEDGEWSYYNGVWYLALPAGNNPLDYPPIDDYDDPRDLD